MTNEECIQELKEELEEVNTWIAIYANDEKVCIPKEKRKKALEMAIKALEQTRWIPVSERLPGKDGFYLATCDREICGDDAPFSGLAEFENGKWVDDEDDYQCVLAWMPLPQPYKESEGKE